MANVTTIKFRRDTSTNWSSKNPKPAAGEPCYETDTKRFKIGDGSTNYNSLPYIDGASITVDSALSDSSTNPVQNKVVKAAIDAKLASNSANYIKSLSISGQTITYTKGDNTTGTLTTQDTVYTLPDATGSTKGGVKIGSNLTISSGTLSLSKSNVTGALGYTPPEQDTTYSQATSSSLGLVKLYTSTGTSTDGTMDRNSLKTALDAKLASNSANYIKALSISGTTITYTKGDDTTGTLTTQDTQYTLPNATSSTLGGVTIGNNISVSSGKISLTKTNVTNALGYTPPTQDTTYSTGTASTAGITKLYTAVGTNTDGTMTQNAIKSALDGKLNSGDTYILDGGSFTS